MGRAGEDRAGHRRSLVGGPELPPRRVEGCEEMGGRGHACMHACLDPPQESASDLRALPSLFSLYKASDRCGVKRSIDALPETA